jgi:serpin B
MAYYLRFFFLPESFFRANKPKKTENMKPSILILISLTLLFNTSCTKDPLPQSAKDPKPIEVSAKSKMVIEGSNRFGFELLRQVWKEEAKENNLMISPLSVELALAMTYNGAGGSTKEAFEKVLHVAELPTQDLNTSLHDLTKALMEVDPRVTMEIANSIWYRNTFHVEDAFLETNKKYFDAEVRPLDFSDPNSKKIINGWVDEKTHHKIPEIIDDIDPSSFMFLINAIYFNGKWKYRFDKKNTSRRPFYITPETTREVPMMTQKGNFLHTANDLFSAVELPYGRGNYSMVFLLPTPEKSLDEVVEALTPENWQQWLNAFDTLNDLTVYVPKFTFSYKKKLNDPLIDLGLGVAFSGNADFSGINPDLDLCISEVRHKTFIKVDEEGTEAAAVTSVEIRFTSAGPGNTFLLDRPFLFVIREKYTNAVLFIGRVSHPEE